jgi:uncharacterized protein DUF1501
MSRIFFEGTPAPRLTRRGFLRIGQVGVSCFYLLPMMRPRNVQASAPAKLRGTAEYCIFLFLNGGPSQIDTFDFKEGRWTPPDFDLRTVKGGPMKLPFGLLPRLAGKLDDLAVVRSVEAWEAGHSRAQFYLQVAHPISPARRNEMPSIGAVIAHETEVRRKTSDFLPPFVSMNFGTGDGAGIIGAGCLDPKLNPLTIDTKGDLNFVVPEAERQSFDRRWKLLRNLEDEPQIGGASRSVEEYRAHYAGAHTMMLAPGISDILRIKAEERSAYGGSALGDACILARNLISAEAGTRYVFISHGGWDLHANAYDKSKPNNQYTLCRELDAAFERLLTDLARLKTKEGAPLLNRTLIVCMGEFGRTVGDLTVNKGRDHHRFASTSLFAGGGVKGGRIIGATDAAGAKVIDSGWSKKRSSTPKMLPPPCTPLSGSIGPRRLRTHPPDAHSSTSSRFPARRSWTSETLTRCSAKTHSDNGWRLILVALLANVAFKGLARPSPPCRADRSVVWDYACCRSVADLAVALTL